MAGGNYYHYEPSLPAALAFTGLFGISTLIHLYQLLRTKAWFWIAFFLGGVFETFGFGARAINAQSGLGNMSFAVTVVSNIGILLAPVLFAASVYMTLGRILLLSGSPNLSIIRPKWLTKIFVLGDVISFLVQAGGVSLLTSDDKSKNDTGRTVMVVGLWIQIVFFGFFIITALAFLGAMSKSKRSSSNDTPWKKHHIVLLSSSSLIMIRCIFRVVEYMQGPSGKLISNEIYVYIFDASLMFIMMVIFHAFHPSEITCRLLGGKMIRHLKVEEYKNPLLEDSNVQLQTVPRASDV